MQTPINRSMPKLNPDWLSSPTANFSSAQNVLITDRINSPIKRTLCPKTRDKADRVRRTATKTISKRCDETHRKASSLKRPKRSAKSDADFSQWTTISAIYPSRLRKTPLGNHTNNRFATQFQNADDSKPTINHSVWQGEERPWISNPGIYPKRERRQNLQRRWCISRNKQTLLFNRLHVEREWIADRIRVCATSASRRLSWPYFTNLIEPKTTNRRNTSDRPEILCATHYTSDRPEILCATLDTSAVLAILCATQPLSVALLFYYCLTRRASLYYACAAEEPSAPNQQLCSCLKAARISCHVRPLLCISASVCSSLSFSFNLSFWKAPSAADHVGIKCTSSTLRKHTYTDPHANGVSFSIRVPACACLAGCIPRSLWSSDHLRERAKV